MCLSTCKYTYPDTGGKAGLLIREHDHFTPVRALAVSSLRRSTQPSLPSTTQTFTTQTFQGLRSGSIRILQSFSCPPELGRIRPDSEIGCGNGLNPHPGFGPLRSLWGTAGIKSF